MTAHTNIFQGVHIHCMESCAADSDAFMCRKKPGPLGDAHPKLPPKVNVASVRSACEVQFRLTSMDVVLQLSENQNQSHHLI